MLIQGIHAVLNIIMMKNATEAYPLTDTAITMLLQKPDTKTVVEKAVAITDPTAGTCKVYLTPEDLSESGMYSYQLIVTFADATISKSAINGFYVADSIPNAISS